MDIRPVMFLFASMGLVAAAQADTATVLPFRDLTTATPTGHLVMDVPAGTQADALISFDTTGLLEATTAAAMLAPATGDPFAQPNPSTKILLLPARASEETSYQDMPGIYVTYRNINESVIAELPETDASGYTLYLGLDSNGDGIPQPDETLCTSVSSSSTPARCIYRPIDGAHAGFGSNFWVLVQAPAGAQGRIFSATLSGGINYYSGVYRQVSRYADPDSNSTTVTVGPGLATPESAFSLRTSWLVPLQGGKRYYSTLLMGPDHALTASSTVVLPFAVTYNAEQTDVQSAIPLGPDGTLGGQTNLLLEPGQTLTHVFFDLPQADHYNPIAVSVGGLSPASTSALGDVDVYVARADFPSASDSALVAPAPPATQGVAGWNAGAVFAGTLAHPSAGRWYVVFKNSGSKEISLRVRVQTLDDPGQATPWEARAIRFGAESNPTLVEGAYFNLKRGGHGIFLSRGYNQQVVDWYTFLEDGTPVFYVAQNIAPPSNSGWWSAPLYRAVWNPQGDFPKIVGSVSLAPTSENNLIFTWQLEGESGAETFTLLARTGACPTFDGSITNFNGNWFAPSQSGYGVDVLALPEQQFDTFYLYDALGNPTWVIGANNPFSASSSLDMLQSTGFCPLCAWQPLTTRPVGSMAIAYASATSGQLRTQITFAAPLNGTWNTDRPIIRLTGSSACQ